MKRSRYLLLAVLLIGLFSLACSLTDKAVDKAKDAAQDAVQEVSKTAEAAAGEVAQQAEKAGEEAQQAAQQAQEKAAESGEKAADAAQQAGEAAQQAGEAAQQAGEAAQAAAEGETEEADLNIDNIDSTLANFDSYRSQFIMSFEGVDSAGAPSNGKVEVLSEHVKEPPAMHMSMKMEGATTGEENGSVNMETYVVDGMNYTYMDELGWMSSPATGDDAFSQGFFSTDDMLSDLPKSAKRSLLPQTVNGISTWHYTFDENDLKKDMTDMEIEYAKGEVWVARDGGYPVKMSIEIKGKDIAGSDDASFMANGVMKMDYELLEVNGNIDISPPEEALSGNSFGGGGNDSSGGNDSTGGTNNAAADFPMLDDAEVQLSMGGMLNYFTAASVQDTAAFYKDKLPAAGWSFDASSEFTTEDSAMLSFTKDNKELSLIIGTEDDGKTNVTLMSTEQ